MGNGESVIGGLDDADIEDERPASFGPIQFNVQVPSIPRDLQCDESRKNGVCGSHCSTDEHSHEQVVGMASHAIAEYLDEDNATKYHKRTQPKLKIRAVAQSRGQSKKLPANPTWTAPLTNTSESFILHSTWVKVFLPTLMHLFFTSDEPFKHFENGSPAFVNIIQEAFDATHPTVSFFIMAGDAIATTVSSACILGLPRLMYYPSLSGVRTAQMQAFVDSF